MMTVIFPSVSQFDYEKVNQGEHMPHSEEVVVAKKPNNTWFFAIQSGTQKWDLARARTFNPLVGMQVPNPEDNDLLEENWFVALVVKSKATSLFLDAMEKFDRMLQSQPAGQGEFLDQILKLVGTCIAADRKILSRQSRGVELPPELPSGSRLMLVVPGKPTVEWVLNKSSFQLQGVQHV